MKFYRLRETAFPTLISFVILIEFIFLILSLSQKNMFWQIQVAHIIIIVLLAVICFLYRKTLFAKIILDEQGIRVVYREQNIKSIIWTDIISLKATAMFRSRTITITSCLGENLWFNRNFRIIHAIHKLCESEKIRKDLEHNFVVYFKK